MSESTTTITVKPTIYPYATPTGIIQLVPLEALEQAIQERDLARERGFETADVLTATERERDRLKEELASMTRRLQAAEHINEGYRAMEQKLEEAQAAVAELNQRLIERTQDMLAKQTELIQEARQAKREARDALAQAVRRMEAVPTHELARIWDGHVDTIRARLIAAAKGEGQAKDVPKADPTQPWTPTVGNVEANPVRPNAAECGQCADKATFHLAPGEG